jgi:hypothetical protein
MDALFQEGQSAPQTPQTLFNADFEGLASNAEQPRSTIMVETKIDGHFYMTLS